MTEQHEHDALFDYFNGTLQEVERTAFENHLKHCADCREELAELQMLTENLPFTAEPVTPNEGMKDRVLAAVFSETATKEQAHTSEKTDAPVVKKQRSRRWLQPLLAASLLLSLGANAYFYLQDRPPSAEPSTASIIQNVQLAATEGFNGSAQAAMVKEDGRSSLIVQAEQLRGLTGTEAYQVWLIDKSGEKVRVGTFRPNENGNGAVAHEIPEPENSTWKMVAVTLEPSPYSEQPLGNIVLAAEL